MKHPYLNKDNTPNQKRTITLRQKLQMKSLEDQNKRKKIFPISTVLQSNRYFHHCTVMHTQNEIQVLVGKRRKYCYLQMIYDQLYPKRIVKL